MVFLHFPRLLIWSVAFSLFAVTTHAQAAQDIAQGYTLKPVEEMLQDLYLLKQRERSGEEIAQPRITVMQGNELPVSGFLVDFKDKRDKRGVVLEIEGTSDLSFLELYWITGITIHEANKIAPYLVEMTVSDIKASATRLDIKNNMKRESDRLNNIVGPILFNLEDEDIPSNGQQLYLTNLFVTDIAMSLTEIAKTDLGKQSIKSSINRIRIKKGKALDVKLESGTLLVYYNFIRSYTTKAARNQLIDKIYNIL